MSRETGSYAVLTSLAVVKQDRLTTKVRIVPDAAVKYHGVSLNDVVFQDQSYNMIFLTCCFDLEGNW